MNSLAIANFTSDEMGTLQQVCREADGISNVIDINSFRRPLNAERVYEAAARVSGLYLQHKGCFELPLKTLHNMLVFAATSPSLEVAVLALEHALPEDGSQIRPGEYMLKTKEIARYLANSQHSI